MPTAMRGGRDARKADGRDILAQVLIVVSAVGASAWYVYAEARTAGMLGFSLDDSWIYATFARNLATGNGYSFNPGETSGGATGPLYVFLTAALYLLFREPVLSAKLLGVACVCASALLLFRSVRHIRPRNPVAPALAGILFALSPIVLWGALSGMEVPLYLLLVSAGLFFYVREQWTPATVFWCLGVWVRPEGFVLVLLGLFARRGLDVKSLLRPTAAAILIAGAYVAANYFLGHSPLPSSVGVKSNLAGNPLERIGSMVEQWTDIWGVSFRHGRVSAHAPLLLPLVVAGAAFGIRRYPAVALFALFFPFIFALSGASGGQHARYIVPVVPFGILLGVGALERLSLRVSIGPRWRTFRLLGAACVLWQCYSAFLTGWVHAWNVQNINGMHRFIGERMRQVAAGDTIAVNDVGAIGYFSGAYIVDLVGLVSPRRSFEENIRRYRPDWLVVFPDWFYENAVRDPQTGQFVFYSPDSATKYSPVIAVRLEHNTIASRNTMYIYERLPAGAPGTERGSLILH